MDNIIATPKVTTGPLPSSRKIYSRPETAPDLKVPVREILLTDGSGEQGRCFAMLQEMQSAA